MHEGVGTALRATIERLDGELASLERPTTADLRRQSPASPALLPHQAHHDNATAATPATAKKFEAASPAIDFPKHDSSTRTLPVTLRYCSTTILLLYINT